MTIKVVEFRTASGKRAFPVESEDHWGEDAKKLLDVLPLFATLTNIRDPTLEDDLEEMLESQHACFVEFADQNEHLISDDQFDAGVDLYCKTWEALL